MRTAAEWADEVRCRRSRLELERRPWLRELLERFAVAAERELLREEAR